MAIYDFRDVSSGEMVEVSIPMDKAPKFGALIQRDGRKLRRVIVIPRGHVKYNDIFWNYQVCRNTDAAGADFYNAKGVPGWKSRASAREWAAKRSGRGLATTFDG